MKKCSKRFWNLPRKVWYSYFQKNYWKYQSWYPERRTLHLTFCSLVVKWKVTLPTMNKFLTYSQNVQTDPEYFLITPLLVVTPHLVVHFLVVILFHPQHFLSLKYIISIKIKTLICPQIKEDLIISPTKIKIGV